MSPSKADPEMHVGVEFGFGKRCALISVSVLLTMAGALSYRHTASAGMPPFVAGLRRLQGRRLPHIITCDGMTYDFHGGPGGSLRPWETWGVSGQVVNHAEKVQPCCCTEEAVEIPKQTVCNMVFEDSYQSTWPPFGGPDKPFPPAQYPTRPAPVTLKGLTTGQCCCDDNFIELGQKTCKLSYDADR